MIKNNHKICIGRRKSSVARVSISRGKGKVIINHREPLEYFKRESLVMMLNQPFTIIDFDIKYHAGFDSVIVPIYQKGELLGSVQRNISRNPKYVNSPGMDRDKAVFPLDKVECDDKVIIVEGLFDSINSHQQGVKNVVCTFGGNVSHEQAKTLSTLARTVVICPDKDVSGIKMAYKTTDTLMKLGLTVEYTFPPGTAKDFGDMTDFSGLEYHSYWKLKAIQKDLNYMMERS